MDLKDYLIIVVIFAVLDGVKSYLRNLIGNAPNRKHEKDIEEIKSLKAYELQVDSYYRNISNELISTLMGKWYLLAFDSNELLTNNGAKNIKIIKGIMNDTIAYGSKKTIRRLALFQNYNYENQSIGQNTDETTGADFVAMYLISYIVSSLKEDFTGEGIDPDDLLKIKLTDYNKNKDLLLKAHKEAKKILSSN